MNTKAYALACAGLFLIGCVVGGEGADLEDDQRGDSQSHYLIIAENTFLKLTTEQSSTLSWGSEKCRLFGGADIRSATAPELVEDHYLIDMTTHIPGCEFAIGYVWTGHVAETSRPDIEPEDPDVPDNGGTDLCHANISVRECALLSTIAYAEGTDERYDIIFSFETFTSYADHPRRTICSGAYCSDAAGRYQFLAMTWDWVAPKLDLSDFSPASQDLAALWLIDYRGVENIDSIDTYQEFVDAMYDLNLEWASLPGSPYGQPTHSAEDLWVEYQYHAGL